MTQQVLIEVYPFDDKYCSEIYCKDRPTYKCKYVSIGDGWNGRDYCALFNTVINTEGHWQFKRCNMCLNKRNE